MVKKSNGPVMNCFIWGQSHSWFFCSNFCLWSWYHHHNDKVLFSRLSSLICFWSISLLRIEKRFETRGIELGFISFYLNPVCGLASPCPYHNYSLSRSTRAWGLRHQPIKSLTFHMALQWCIGASFVCIGRSRACILGKGCWGWYLKVMQKVIIWQMKFCLADLGH